MRLLFLRGQVPKDRPSSQILFENIDECDDMWTQLAYSIAKGEQSELWYWGGQRKNLLGDNFLERWVLDFYTYKSRFNPDVIIARGGFDAYTPILKKYPNAFKIYYGAGKRFFPQGYDGFDLIVVDSPQQLLVVRKKFPKIRSSLFIKPAADNIFFKVEGKKEYDCIFVGNYTSPKRDLKNHGFILKSFPKDLKLLQVGIAPSSIRKRYPHVKFLGWQPRNNLKYLYANAKISIVACTSIDSCPRVIPESLACGCPLLILDSVRFWQEKYITKCTGIVTQQNQYWKVLREMLKSEWNTRGYYESNLSVEHAAEYLSKIIYNKIA